MSVYNISRESPIPVYHQIASDIRRRIIDNEWGPTGQIASENTLVKQYGVSRVTLRQALAELEKDGIIKRLRGKGAFVNENPNRFIHDLQYSLVNATFGSNAPGALSARMIELTRITEPYQNVQEALQLTREDACIYFKRVFYLENQPIALGKSWLPAHLVPGLEEEGLIDNSLSATLTQRYHLTVARVDDVLESVRPTLNEKSLLDTSYDTPLILIKGISRLDGGTPLEYSHTYWLGDRVRFHFSLVNQEGRLVLHSPSKDSR